MSAVVLRGDAAHLPLPDASVDLIVTSPPYFGQRDYRDGGESLEGQIGSEETPGEFIATLLRCTREWMRVLKGTGSIFVDLGDKFDSGTTTARINPGTVKDGQGQGWNQGTPRVSAGRPKSLLMLPERYRIACADELGLIVREVIEWDKPNPIPESAEDRCSRTHEDVVHLVKQPRYFSAVDEIREPPSGYRRPNNYDRGRRGAPSAIKARSFADAVNPLGKRPGSVWNIPSALITPGYLAGGYPSVRPLQWLMTDADAWRWCNRHGIWSSSVPRDDTRLELRAGPAHFAAYPPELPRRIILGWSPSGICLECGEGRQPVAAVANIEDRKGRKQRIVDYSLDAAHGPDGRGGERWKQTVRIIGYACACPDASAPTRPALVVDPFGGTGTSSLVADVLGRTGISIDRSMDYSRLAAWRTRDPGERARALGVPKPPPVPEGQASLFDEAS